MKLICVYLLHTVNIHGNYAGARFLCARFEVQVRHMNEIGLVYAS